MPRDGAITFGDLLGKLDYLRVDCAKCGRAGRYGVERLAEKLGADAKVSDLLDELAADCPRRRAGGMIDRCAANCPELPRVL